MGSANSPNNDFRMLAKGLKLMFAAFGNFLVKLGSGLLRILRRLSPVLVIALAIYNVCLFFSKEDITESALMADASASAEFNGVFIRDEQPVSYSGNGVLSYNVSDGGRVGNGTVIAQIYPTDEQIKINREIESLENELSILNKIQNPGTLESAQPASLSSSIEETYRNIIYCRDTGDYDSISTDMDELLIYLSTYQIITDDSIDFTPRINDINSKLTELRAGSLSPSEQLISDRSAYFVSYCDGYEDVLTKENVGSLTIEELRSVADCKEDSPTVAGKLIDGYEWYLAGIIDNSRKEYNVGDSVTLRFESVSETFKAVIIDVRDEGDPSESIIVVSCDQFNYDLVQHRTENVELVKGDYSGLKVPREAIRFLPAEEEITDEDTGITSIVTTNYKGVYILEGEQVEFRKLDVIYEGSDYVLSAVHEDDKSYLALYDDIIVEGVDSDGK